MSKRLYSTLRAHESSILIRVNILLSLMAVVWLGYEFYRFLWQPEYIGALHVHPGAIDLKLRHYEIHQWFKSEQLDRGLYPPASYAILWPLLGWLSIAPALYLWASVYILCLACSSFILIKESGATGNVQKTFIGLLPLAIYPTGAAVGNGQLIPILLPAMIMALVLMKKRDMTTGPELLSSGLIIITLAKPSLFAPFFWIILFIPKTIRSALYVIIGYLALTFAACYYQENGLVELITNWIAASSDIAANPSKGNSNVHLLLAKIHMDHWIIGASLLMCLGLGIWVYFNRHADIWTLAGVTAIISRLWVYHRWYDDLLILLPMVALFKVLKDESVSKRVDLLALLLLTFNLLLLIPPGGLYLLPSGFKEAYLVLQMTGWLATLIFLVWKAWMEESLTTEGLHGDARQEHV